MSDSTSGDSSPPYFEIQGTKETTTILRVTPRDKNWRTFLHAYKLFQEQVDRRDSSHYDTRSTVGKEFYRTIKEYLSRIDLPAVDSVDSAVALDDSEIVVRNPSYTINDKQGEGGLIFKKLIFSEPKESEIKVIGSINSSRRNSNGHTIDILLDLLAAQEISDIPFDYEENNLLEDNETRRYFEIAPIKKIPAICKAFTDVCGRLEGKTLTDLKSLYEGIRRTNGRAEEILTREYQDLLSKIPFHVV